MAEKDDLDDSFPPIDDFHFSGSGSDPFKLCDFGDGEGSDKSRASSFSGDFEHRYRQQPARGKSRNTSLELNELLNLDALGSVHLRDDGPGPSTHVDRPSPVQRPSEIPRSNEPGASGSAVSRRLEDFEDSLRSSTHHLPFDGNGDSAARPVRRTDAPVLDEQRAHFGDGLLLDERGSMSQKSQESLISRHSIGITDPVQQDDSWPSPPQHHQPQQQQPRQSPLSSEKHAISSPSDSGRASDLADVSSELGASQSLEVAMPCDLGSSSVHREAQADSDSPELDERCAALESELAVARDQLVEQSAQLAGVHRAVLDADEALEKAASRVGSAEASAAALRDERDQAVLARDVALADAARLRDDCGSARSSFERFGPGDGHHLAEVAALSAKLSEAQVSAEAADARCFDVGAELEEARHQLSDQSAMLTAALEASRQATGAAGTAEQNVADLRSDVARLRGELDSTRAAQLAAVGETEQLRSELDCVADVSQRQQLEKVDRDAVEAAELRAQLGEARASVADAESRWSATTGDLISARARLAKESAQLGQVEEELRAAGGVAAEARQRAADNEDLVASLRWELQEATVARESAANEALRLRREFSNMRAETSRVGQSAADEVATLETTEANLRAQLHGTAAAQEAAGAEMSRLHQELHEARAQSHDKVMGFGLHELHPSLALGPEDAKQQGPTTGPALSGTRATGVDDVNKRPMPAKPVDDGLLPRKAISRGGPAGVSAETRALLDWMEGAREAISSAVTPSPQSRPQPDHSAPAVDAGHTQPSEQGKVAQQSVAWCDGRRRSEHSPGGAGVPPRETPGSCPTEEAPMKRPAAVSAAGPLPDMRRCTDHLEPPPRVSMGMEERLDQQPLGDLRREYHDKLQLFRGTFLPELQTKRNSVRSELQAIDDRACEVRNRCAEAKREAREDFEMLRCHLGSVESVKLATLSREREVRSTLVDGIDSVTQRMSCGNLTVREFEELRAQAESHWSRSSSLPEVQVSLEDIPFEARDRAAKLRRLAVMGTLLQWKDSCLWSLEQQRRELAREFQDLVKGQREVEDTLNRYQNELDRACYFCGAPLSVEMANSRCRYNLGCPDTARPHRVPPHLWGVGVHFWVAGPSSSDSSGHGQRSAGRESALVSRIDHRAPVDSCEVLQEHLQPDRQYALRGPWRAELSEPPKELPEQRGGRRSGVDDIAAVHSWQPPHAEFSDHWRSLEHDSKARQRQKKPSEKSQPRDSSAGVRESGKGGSAPSHPPWPTFGATPAAASDPFPGTSNSAEAHLRRILRVCEERGVDIHSAFKAFDRTGDGFISQEEFRHALARLRLGLSVGEVGELLDQLDVNADGMVSYEEFLIHMFRSAHNPSQGVESAFLGHSAHHDADAKSLWARVGKAFRDRGVHLRQVFALFDADGNGVISKRELREAFRLMRLGLSDDDMARLLRSIDSNKDGNVSIHEFINRLK